ncbi:SIT4 phosphatase-associated protein-domain-containing protein [Emericellopsis atlantica]|uniref:SIT4 phosphatase-associated protein-domain-containing protein n=1 Tax=Emericellopsis atlantica TaxID=2614577 RepID=A0A9P7ZH91_9HYPO|nr:SIT4 phosphatase-associated protein-domain-containing protein [Emericellopsis atlantica]KAG9251661.1 SIT4 phosphatase-associated protein-domain-containing protein [Emericellopsis atlantica]
MFWRFGGYANISTIDTILDKENFTLEELLDESDLIQELKQPNSKLIEYLREEKVLEKLLDYAVAPRLEVFETTDDQDDESGKGKNRLLSFSRPRASSRTTDATENEDDEADKKRNRYAFVSCEILSSDTWSIYEALTENRELIRNFWNFLQRESPLDPLQASYFTKINESLFEKKTDEMMDLLRSLPDPVGDLLKHVECPMVMDLLLKIIALDRNEGGQGVVEWLYSKNIIPTLLSFLSPEHSWVVQTAAGDFIKAIITISANASQNEQQCIGPNELTRQLVSRECVERLVGFMLGGGNALTVGVGIIIEVIRKNNSDYDPDVGAGNSATPSAHDPIYLGTLLRMFAENVPKFMDLVLGSSAEKERADSTFGQRLEPLGFDRFKTCELMAELLHCSNMGLLNEVGSEQLIAARDAERQRMRDDGKLSPTKDEDVSTDDLTMRSTQTGQEEARRLEVTNADDDGFEEVEPSKEMSEDTSHEFVKAEAETPPGQQTSLLGKDEDDFVDEPLSPTAPPSGANKPQLDDPELVVAPLSPTKPSAAQPDSTDGASDSTQSSANEGNETSEKDAAKADGKQQTSLTSESPPDEGGLALPVTGPAGGSSKAPAPSEGPLSPHPEDTPAPLFSAPSAPGSGAAKPPQTSGNATEDTQNDQSATLPVDEQDEKTAPASTEPVVGDFLKMQFVDHNVVPTILVRAQVRCSFCTY